MSSKIRYISELDQIANNMWDIMASVYTIEDMFAVYADGDYMMVGKNANSHGMSIHFPRIDGEHDNLYIAMPSYSHLSILGNSIAYAICMKKIREEDVIDISDIITNKVSVKEMNGIRLFATGGLGIEDIALGVELLKNAEENNIGLILEN